MEKIKNIEVNQNNEKQNKNELEEIIKNLKISLLSFNTNLISVFINWWMTEEQKKISTEIISTRKDIILELENILKEINNSKSEIELKRRSLNNYENSEISEENRRKIEDLQKRILELDEKQQIFLKEFNLLSRWEKLNASLNQNEINKMEKINSIDFLKINFDERLRLVTTKNIKSEDIINWKVNEIEINFSFNWKFNRQLYARTTAWMILPEEVREVTVDWKIYKRTDKSLKWEFFNNKWERLIIKDETKIKISKLETRKNLEQKYNINLDLSWYNEIDKEIITEANKRWVDFEIALKLFSKELSKISNKELRLAVLEELFIDIDRRKWYYFSKFWQKAVENWRFSLWFLDYIFEWNFNSYSKIAEKLGYTEEQIKNFNNTRNKIHYENSNIKFENITSLNISREEIARIRQIKRFTPWERDTIILFKIAAKIWWLPESWAENQNLHYILWKESEWMVWRLNYTIKWLWTDRFKELVLSKPKNRNPIWAKSTASWLGQLLLGNIDIYYPSWRNWIWDPIEEAIWFMRYIKERYGNPDIAKSIYWKIWHYNHPTKWRQYKWFREWY